RRRHTRFDCDWSSDVCSSDLIEVQVLNINKEKQEISLGMKQVMPNPWDKVAERYPPQTVVSGVVRNLTNYGAFIEIEEGIDGLRSEERRVGKEGRYRCAPYDE